MEILNDYNLNGLVIGVLTFAIIGLFHPLVIKGEYYFGTKLWYFFLIMGIVCALGSVMIKNPTLSILAGVVAFSSFWSILEVFEQEKRVKKGWFPSNPKKGKKR